MKNNREACSSHSGLWRVVGGVALVLGLIGLARVAPDIKRYWRISSM